MANLRIMSYNVQDLQTVEKRIDVFDYMKSKNMTYTVYRILTLQMKMKHKSLINRVIVTVFSAILNLMQEELQYCLIKSRLQE